MKRVAVLPMDDRPVNYDYPRYLSRAAGMEVLLPPREWLGTPWRASRHAELVEWLARTAPGADAAVVAIDTLAYGGLIPSRTSAATTTPGAHAGRPSWWNGWRARPPGRTRRWSRSTRWPTGASSRRAPRQRLPRQPH